MLDLHLPSRLCDLSCILLGICASLIHPLSNFDIYLLLRYMDIDSIYAQGVWYFFRRFNFMIGVLATLFILTFATANRRDVKRCSWLLFYLYGCLLWMLKPDQYGVVTLTQSFQWLLCGVSVLSNVLQSLSIFYIFDPDAPRGNSCRGSRLVLFTSGYIFSGPFVRFLSYGSTSMDHVYAMGTTEILKILRSTMLVYVGLTFCCALTITVLIRCHWEGPCADYLPLTIGGTVSFILNYDNWKLLFKSALGWSLAPFCGILMSISILNASMRQTSDATTGHYVAFLVYLLSWLFVQHFERKRINFNIDTEMLKIALSDELSKYKKAFAVPDGDKNFKKNNGVSSRHGKLAARLLKNEQPWMLLPHGFWTKWCDEDARDNKTTLQCMEMYVKLLECKQHIENCGYPDACDVMMTQSESTELKCSLLLDIRCRMLWELTCLCNRYEAIAASIPSMNSKCPYKSAPCRFDSLLCSVQYCLGCCQGLKHYKCKNCLYRSSDILGSIMIVVKGTFDRIVARGKYLSKSLGSSWHKDVYTFCNETMVDALRHLEECMGELFVMLLYARLMEEWLFCCRAIQMIDKCLNTILEYSCSRGELCEHFDVCNNSSGTNCRSADSSNSSAETTECTSTQQSQIASKGSKRSNVPEPCGCRLARKLFECVLMLHRKQCDAGELILQGHCDSLDKAMPNMSHVRAVALLSNSYLTLTRSAKNGSGVCSQCQSPSNNCGSTCLHFDPHVDELLDELIDDLDKHEKADRLLSTIISLIASVDKSNLSKKLVRPKKVTIIGKLLSELLFGSFNVALSVASAVLGTPKFEYKRQHCCCTELSCKCCNKSNEKPCPQCLGCCEGDCCDDCKNKGCCSQAESGTAGSCGACSGCSECECPCPNLGTQPTILCCNICNCKSGCCGETSCGTTTCCKKTLVCLAKKACCLIHGLSCCWVVFVKSLCCDTGNKYLMKNLCCFQTYIQNMKSFCQGNGGSSSTTTCCTNNGKGDTCINKNTVTLLQALFKPVSHSGCNNQNECPNNCIWCCSLKCCCKEEKCKCCCGEDNCRYTPKQIFNRLKCISGKYKAITCTLQCICWPTTIIENAKRCYYAYCHYICCYYEEIHCRLYTLIACAQKIACKLKKCVTAVKTKQEENYKALESCIQHLQSKIWIVGAKDKKLNAAMDAQFALMGKNSKLMDEIDEFTKTLHKKVGRTRRYIDTTKRSIYLDSLKDVLCRIMYIGKDRCATPLEEWSTLFLRIYVVWIFCLVFKGISVDLLPHFGISGHHTFYKTAGYALSIVSSYLLMSGFSTMAKLPRQAGYLINVVVMLGMVMTICFSWVLQGFAYRSYMIGQFKQYQHEYRVVYPDYANPPRIRCGEIYDGFVSLVKADAKGISDFVYLKDVVYNSDPYGLGHSSRFNMHSTPSCNMIFRWTDKHTAYHARVDVLSRDIRDLTLFFDYIAFKMTMKHHWYFLTDVPMGRNIPYTFDLMWNAWLKGNTVTEGHQKVRDARLEALENVSNGILSECEGERRCLLNLEAKLRNFQKAQSAEMGRRCIDIQFLPDTVKFPFQRDSIVTLFEDEYRLLWDDYTRNHEDDVSEGPSSQQSATIEDLSQMISDWTKRTNDICKSKYGGNAYCLAIVSQLANNFDGFLKTLSDGKEFDTVEELLQFYEAYSQSPSHVEFKAPCNNIDGELCSLLPSNAENDFSLVESANANQPMEVMGGRRQNAKTTFNTYLLGEWIKKQGVHIPSSALEMMLKG
ncbi:hypothetical protein BgAZ_303750 [Babesia gibsoni]|uniref:Uncharacterized protein n=1 Tax=Babesia gibsoni TaxID=33632 RepID=A0AAD8LR38_BABGI|nr:hypothetical protein BgAZ_303750 [Babesia gibsoni]